MHHLLTALLLAALHPPAQAVTAVVLDMPGFAWNGHGWIPELLGRLQLQQQAINLRLLPPARAVERYYRGGEGELFAADLLCRRHDSHFLTLGVRDYEVFITRQGDKVPGPGNLPPPASACWSCGVLTTRLSSTTPGCAGKRSAA